MNRPAPLVLVLAVVLALLAACGDDGGDRAQDEDAALPRTVTTAEAELLAAMRFRSFQEGPRELDVTFSLGGVDARLTGWVDHVHHEGYVVSSEGGEPVDLVAWGAGTIAVQPAGVLTGSPARPPLPPPTPDAVVAGWQRAVIDPSSSPLHTILGVVLSLASDRPDNALLIQQGGAQLVGTDHIDDVEVSVFTGPRAPGSTEASSLRYWVDDTGLLHRAELRLPDGTTVRIDLGTAADLQLALGLDAPPR